MVVAFALVGWVAGLGEAVEIGFGEVVVRANQMPTHSAAFRDLQSASIVVYCLIQIALVEVRNA